MKNHINQIFKLKEARDFHAPTDIAPLSIVQVNLTFLNSLDSGWKLFHQALSDNTYTMKTGELFVRVEVLDYWTIECTEMMFVCVCYIVLSRAGIWLAFIDFRIIVYYHISYLAT